MEYIENVQGSKELAVPLIFQVDTVYVKENIREETVTDPTTGDIRNVWLWNEWQYSYPEWREIELQRQITEQDITSIVLGQFITDLDLRLLELEVNNG